MFIAAKWLISHVEEERERHTAAAAAEKRNDKASAHARCRKFALCPSVAFSKRSDDDGDTRPHG